MYSNTFKIAWRKLWKHKASTLTKLFSLAIGITSLVYIGLYLQKEYSFDKFHPKLERIVKLNTSIQTPTGGLDLGLSAVPLGPYLASSDPAVAEYLRLYKEHGKHSVRQGEYLFSESENIIYADPNFFNFFDFTLLSGDPEKALLGPNKIILTRSAALKYFGRTEVAGEVLQYDGTPITVSAVLEDLPANTHLQFDFLFSMDTFMVGRDETINDNWGWFPMNTYLLLQPQAKRSELEKRLEQLPQYLPEADSGERSIVSMEPLEGLHFSAVKLGELGPKGKISNLYLLLAIAVLILFLAISNYINLSTAAISVEARDVSMKRTLGANKGDIIKQFLAESFLVCLLAIALSLLVILLSFPAYSELMGVPLESSFISNPLLWLTVAILPFLLAALGGIYPALKFASIPALYAEVSMKGRKFMSTRTALIVFQFAITSGLVIGSLLIFKQLQYIENKDLGFDARQKVVIDYGPNGAIGNAFESLKERLLQIPGVNRVSFSSHVPGQIPNGVSTVLLDGTGNNRSGEINLNLVDPDFLSSYGLELVAGRDFREGVADSTAALILNEAAVKAFGYSNPEEILGVPFEQWGGNGRVIGVVRDFNYLSLHEDVGLLSLKVWPVQFEKITLEISEADIMGTLSTLEVRWQELYPDIPFNYYFVEDNFLRQYTRDREFATIMHVFTIISVCIGVLGLIAFASFWCDRRKKEMSIKKVLGARPLTLLSNLLTGFSIPVLVGFALALPVCLYLWSRWLDQFAYSVELPASFFLLPLAILLSLVVLAVGAQTLALVHTNPVDQLKEN